MILRLDFQPFWESGCLSSSQLRLDHWSVALVRDVTSAFYANYHARYTRGKMAAFVALQNVKPVSKDVFYVEMFWTVRRKG